MFDRAVFVEKVSHYVRIEKNSNLAKVETGAEKIG